MSFDFLIISRWTCVKFALRYRSIQINFKDDALREPATSRNDRQRAKKAREYN